MNKEVPFKPKWVFEKETFEDIQEELMAEVTRQGMEYVVLDYYPYRLDRSRHLSDVYHADGCVVVYTSLQMARFIQQQNVWTPGVFMDLPKFECLHYYAHLGKFLLNSPYIMLPFGELLRLKEDVFYTMGNNGCVFIRPSSGFKLFTGKVVEYENYEREIDKFSIYDVEPDKLVIVAEAKNIVAEYRLVIADSKVVGSCQYMEDRQHIVKEGCPNEVLTLANEIIATWQPEPAWTLDICKVGNEYKLLEIGSFSCANMYGCNKASVVSAIADLAVKLHKEEYE